MSISNFEGAVKSSVDVGALGGDPANWKAVGVYGIAGARGGMIASFPGPYKTPRRDFVLRACQQHAKLADSHAALIAAVDGYQVARDRWEDAGLQSCGTAADVAEVQAAAQAHTASVLILSEMLYKARLVEEALCG